jgi:polyhydroxybutyrate depolymerase
MKITGKLIFMMIFMIFIFSNNSFLYSRKRTAGGKLSPGDYSRPVPNWPRRPYELHIPDKYNPEHPAPVILAIHGGGGNSKSMARLTCPRGDLNDPDCLDRLADQAGFIVVYPNGTPVPILNDVRTFNAGGGEDGFMCVSGRACEKNIDDIDYFISLLRDLEQVANVDSSRIYATGISNGAAMSHRLACELSDRIAAIAAVGGGDQFGITEGRNPARPVPVLQIHGTEDPSWPYEGGEGQRSGGRFVSIPDTVHKWASRNGCSSLPVVTYEPDRDRQDGTRVRKEIYSSCREGADVILYMVEGGGHTWPGGYQYLTERKIGKVSTDISANKVILEFFQHHAIGN